METNQQKIDTDDSVILENVIKALRTNAKQLSVDLGYKSPTSIYHILQKDQRNKITLTLAEKIVDKYPEVNFLYLTRGTYPILKEKKHDATDNLFQKRVDLNSLLEIPKTLGKILQQLEDINQKIK